MITQFKIFENDEQFTEPQVGDYVICYQKYGFAKNSINNIINNNIGKIIFIKRDEQYLVQYSCHIPDNLKTFFDDGPEKSRYIQKEEIIHWSNNKEELQLKIDSNKYNL